MQALVSRGNRLTAWGDVPPSRLQPLWPDLAYRLRHGETYSSTLKKSMRCLWESFVMLMSACRE